MKLKKVKISLTFIENKEKLSCFRGFSVIKQLSQYMLLMIKDFEVVSSVENNKEITICPITYKIKKFVEEIKDIIEVLIKKKDNINIQFVETIQTSIKYFTCDFLRLKQILLNLISNAIKFTNQGSIEFNIEDVAKDPLLENKNHIAKEDTQINSGAILDNKLKFSIIDTGKGIDPEKQKKLFDSESKENSIQNLLGDGYGLGIVKNLCHKLGSNIIYSPNQPYGSVFSFVIREDKFYLSDDQQILLTDKSKLNEEKEIEFKDFRASNLIKYRTLKEELFVKRIQTFLLN